MWTSHLRPALVLVAVFTLLTGLGCPLAMTVVRVWEGDVSKSPESVAQALLDRVTRPRSEHAPARSR